MNKAPLYLAVYKLKSRKMEVFYNPGVDFSLTLGPLDRYKRQDLLEGRVCTYRRDP